MPPVNVAPSAGTEFPGRLKVWSKSGIVAGASGAAAICLLYFLAFRGWIPHDEGTLGQAASRILDGQWPHIDYLDVYPGLQGYFHAAVFALIGESVASLRIAWLGVAGTASAAICLITMRWARPLVSGVGSAAVTVLAFTIYPSSVPSWWNVTLGLLVLGLVLTAVDRASLTLLCAAGLVTGFSVLIKTTGGILVAVAVFVWLVASQVNSRPWIVSSAGAGSAVLVAILAPGLTLGRALLVGLPALGGLLLAAGVGVERAEWKEVALPKNALIYGLGVLLPPLAVAFGYSVAGRLPALVEGWVTSPALRYTVAEGDVPVDLSSLLIAVTVAGAIYYAKKRGMSHSALAWICVTLVLTWGVLDWYVFGRFVLATVLWLPPLLVVAGLARRHHWRGDSILLVATALTFTMIQIPVWNGFYTAYTIPLLALAVLSISGGNLRTVVALLGALALMFFGQSLGGRLSGPEAMAEAIEYEQLSTGRAGISVPVEYAFYDSLIGSVREIVSVRDDAGPYIYAGPDAPEIAFLAGVRAATPGLFEALDLNWQASLTGDLAEQGVPVVINHDPQFSSALPSDELARIYAALPNTRRYGNFELRWLDARN